MRSRTFTLPKKNVKVNNYYIDTRALNAAAEQGKFLMRQTDETERQMRVNNVTIRRNSPSYTHLLFFQTQEGTIQIGRQASLGVISTREVGRRYLKKE